MILFKCPCGADIQSEYPPPWFDQDYFFCSKRCAAWAKTAKGRKGIPIDRGTI